MGDQIGGGKRNNRQEGKLVVVYLLFLARAWVEIEEKISPLLSFSLLLSRQITTNWITFDFQQMPRAASEGEIGGLARSTRLRTTTGDAVRAARREEKRKEKRKIEDD